MGELRLIRTSLKFLGALLLLTLLFVQTKPARAEAPVLELDDTIGEQELQPYLEVRFASANEPGWPHVRELAFEPASTRGYGVTDETFWGRVTVHNGTPHEQTRWVEVAYALVDWVWLYEERGDGSFTSRVTGRLAPVTARELPRRTYTFRVVIPAGATREIYLAARNESGELVLPLRLWKLESLLDHDARLSTRHGLMFGVLAAMTMLNLSLFAFTRDVAHGLYASAVMAACLFLGAIDGSAPLILPAVAPVLGSPWLYLWASLVFWWAFAYKILGVAEGRPWMRRLVLAVLALVLSNPVLYPILPGEASLALGVLTTLGMIGAWIIVGLARLGQGHRPAFFFVAAWAWIGVTTLAFTNGMSSVLDLELSTIPMLAYVGEALLMAIALAHATSDRARHIEALQHASSRFVPLPFLELLGHRELPEVRRGEQVARTMTVWFSDIRSFTTLVEGLPPAEAMQLVNDVLVRIEPAITQNGGVIDKYIGDAVMALFDSPDGALRAARDALVAVAQLGDGERRVHMGIGLHTGPLVLGVVGSDRRLSCTVLGDSVNLASRVESLTKRYGAALLLTEETRQALAGPERWTLRRVDRVQVKGKQRATTLHQVLEVEPAELRDSLPEFEAGLTHYDAGRFADAAIYFTRCASAVPHDAAASLLATRCAHLEREAPLAWEGVMRLDEK